MCNHVIEDIENQLGLFMPSPIIWNQRSYRVAPSLYGIIKEAVAETRLLDSNIIFTEESDAAIASCAQNVINNLPTPERDRLTDTCRRAARLVSSENPFE